MHVLVIHSCSQTLHCICSTLQAAGVHCECHTSPVAATYSFAFSCTPFVAVLAGRGLGVVRDGDVLQVIRSLQPGIVIFEVDSAREAQRAAFEVMRMMQAPHVLHRDAHLANRIP